MTRRSGFTGRRIVRLGNKVRSGRYGWRLRQCGPPGLWFSVNEACVWSAMVWIFSLRGAKAEAAHGNVERSNEPERAYESVCCGIQKKPLTMWLVQRILLTSQQQPKKEDFLILELALRHSIKSTRPIIILRFYVLHSYF